MSAAGRWFITPHAVRRYIERIDRKASYDLALARLIALGERAHFVKVGADGIELWRVNQRDGRIRFRVSKASPGALPQLLTVLPAFGSGSL